METLKEAAQGKEWQQEGKYRRTTGSSYFLRDDADTRTVSLS